MEVRLADSPVFVHHGLGISRVFPWCATVNWHTKSHRGTSKESHFWPYKYLAFVQGICLDPTRRLVNTQEPSRPHHPTFAAESLCSCISAGLVPTKNWEDTAATPEQLVAVIAAVVAASPSSPSAFEKVYLPMDNNHAWHSNHSKWKWKNRNPLQCGLPSCRVYPILPPCQNASSTMRHSPP